MRLRKEDYVARIASATTLQLTIINYELLLNHIGNAQENMGNQPLYEAEIQKAQAFLKLLQDTLRMEYEVSKDLFKIYVYVNKLLITALFSKKTDALSEASELLSTLLGGWSEIEKNSPASRPMMENAQQIFAGLTYHNGELSELIVEDPGRGYKA